MSKCRGLHCEGCGDGGGGWAIIAAVGIVSLIIWRLSRSHAVRTAFHITVEAIFWGAIAALGIGVICLGCSVGTRIVRRSRRVRHLDAAARVTLSPESARDALGDDSSPAAITPPPDAVYGPLSVYRGDRDADPRRPGR